MIGCIRAITEGAAKALIFKIEDGTGNLEVKKWADGGARNENNNNEDEEDDDEMDGSGSKQLEYEVGQYVHIIGSTRIFNGKRSITVQSMRKITDFNEVIYHNAKALATHLELARGGAGKNTNTNQEKSNGDLFVANNNNASNALQDKILKVIETGDQDTGTHVDVIARQLNESHQNVMREVEDLEQMGHIYQPEEQHYLKIG